MDKKEILQLRLHGLTYTQIAKQFRVSPQRIQQIISPPKEIRYYIINKFNGKCKECGVFVGKSGHIHHKGTQEEDKYNDIDNLELLCQVCHTYAHWGEKGGNIPIPNHSRNLGEK